MWAIEQLYHFSYIDYDQCSINAPFIPDIVRGYRTQTCLPTGDATRPYVYFTCSSTYRSITAQFYYDSICMYNPAGGVGLPFDTPDCDRNYYCTDDWLSAIRPPTHNKREMIIKKYFQSYSSTISDVSACLSGSDTLMTAFEAIPNQQCINFYYSGPSSYVSKYADFPELHSYSQVDCQSRDHIDTYNAYTEQCQYVNQNPYSIASAQACCWGWGSVHFDTMQSISVLASVSNRTAFLPSSPSPTLAPSSFPGNGGNSNNGTSQSSLLGYDNALSYIIVGSVVVFFICSCAVCIVCYCLCHRGKKANVESFDMRCTPAQYHQVTATVTTPSAPLSPTEDVEMMNKGNRDGDIPLAIATEVPQNGTTIVIESNQVYTL